MASGKSEEISAPKSRVILQQCLSAKLMVEPKSDASEAKYTQIGRGLVVYICFLKDASEDILDKMVKSILSACLSEDDNGKLVSVLDLPGDVLIIPQATMGGNLKGKKMQYHRNVNKETGLNLYTKFIQMCEDVMMKSDKCKERQTVVRYGTYGNRQVFSMDTNGPYSHVLEF
ncbi:D-tyrosyl-tRNA(Tyr) deacylase [Mactra antiquata]